MALECVPETSAEILAHEPIDKRIDGAVGVSRAVSHDFADVESRGQDDVISEIVVDVDHVQRQPADGEDQYDDEDHAGDSTSMSGGPDGVGLQLLRVRCRGHPDFLGHQEVSGRDDADWHGIAQHEYQQRVSLAHLPGEHLDAEGTHFTQVPILYLLGGHHGGDTDREGRHPDGQNDATGQFGCPANTQDGENKFIGLFIIIVDLFLTFFFPDPL